MINSISSHVPLTDLSDLRLKVSNGFKLICHLLPLFLKTVLSFHCSTQAALNLLQTTSAQHISNTFHFKKTTTIQQLFFTAHYRCLPAHTVWNCRILWSKVLLLHALAEGSLMRSNTLTLCSRVSDGSHHDRLWDHTFWSAAATLARCTSRRHQYRVGQKMQIFTLPYWCNCSS